MDARNFQYMFYGFSAAWVLIVIYAFSMLARERKIKAENSRAQRAFFKCDCMARTKSDVLVHATVLAQRDFALGPSV